MSAHDRKFEHFETPAHYIAALLGDVNIHGRVYEPCVGEGAIAEALRKLPSVHKVVTNDIDWNRQADTHYDSTMQIEPHPKPYDWIVTNPPFSQELEILDMMSSQGTNLAFLARLSFLEPTEDRAYFLEQTPPSRVIVLPRYSFRPNDEGKRQTDSVTCCWLVWSNSVAPGVAAWGRGKSEAYAVLRNLQ